MAPTTAPRARRRRVTRTHAALANWGTQAVIALVGIYALFDPTLVLGLVVWCGLGSVYALSAVITLARRARTAPDTPSPEEAMPRWMGRVRGAVVTLFAAIPSAIGVTAAFQVLVFGADAELGILVRLVGVWAMLLAWGFLHWGFAQIYAYRAERAGSEKLFDFPGTPRPNLIDYVYFSYTVGTTFAASDVTVLTTRTRWLVTVHSVLSFFINALVIVLSFNTIMGGAG